MTWARTTAERICGRCRSLIVKGEAVCLLTEYRLPRCVTCAQAHGLTPPAVWPELDGPVLLPPDAQPTVYRPLAGLVTAFDARMARTGDSE